MVQDSSNFWKKSRVEMRAAGFDPDKTVKTNAVVTIASAYTNAHRCNNRVRTITDLLVELLAAKGGLGVLSLSRRGMRLNGNSEGEVSRVFRFTAMLFGARPALSTHPQMSPVTACSCDYQVPFRHTGSATASSLVDRFSPTRELGRTA